MTDKDTKKPVRDPFGERPDGPSIVSIADLVKSRPGAKARSEPQPDEQRNPEPQKDIETHVRIPFGEIRSGPTIVNIADLVKSRPGAKGQPDPQLNEQREPGSQKEEG